MPANRSGASTPQHGPIPRASFLSIWLQSEPDATYAAVCRALRANACSAMDALAECSDLIDGHGVESATLADGCELLYVNMGDVYDATLCHVAVRGFFVSSLGDEVEAAERERQDDTGERRCGYCSEWSQPGAACGGCGRDPETGQPWPEPLRYVRLDSGHVLRTWDTGRTRGTGMMARTRIGYELRAPNGDVVFQGDDFGPSPMHSDDSDEALRALLGFLTLHPGDTDADYFASYSPVQLAFAESSDCELLQWLYSEDGPGEFVDVDDDGEVAP